MKSLFDLSARQPPGRCGGGALAKAGFFIIIFLRTSSCKSRVLALRGWHHSHVLPSPQGHRPRQQTLLLRKLLTVLLSGAPAVGSTPTLQRPRSADGLYHRTFFSRSPFPQLYTDLICTSAPGEDERDRIVIHESTFKERVAHSLVSDVCDEE